VRRDAHYPGSHVDLRAGDVIVIYTDGLTEARRGDELFGPERIGKVLDQHSHRRAQDMVQALIDAVRAFAQDPLDDLTVVVLKQLSDPTPDRSGPGSNLPSSCRSSAPDTVGETTDAVSPAHAANPRAADH